jgi:hypothetical protein
VSDKPTINLNQIANMVWLSLLSGVLIMGGVIWFFSTQNLAPQIEERILHTLFIVGLLSALPFFLVRSKGRSRVDQQRWRTTEFSQGDPINSQTLMRKIILTATLAELPMLFAIVYTVMGGALLMALALWSISLIFMLISRPGTIESI